MRILHISKYYSPYLGGVENICKYLVEGCVNHNTTVVCFADKRQDVTGMVNGHMVYPVFGERAEELAVLRQRQDGSCQRGLPLHCVDLQTSGVFSPGIPQEILCRNSRRQPLLRQTYSLDYCHKCKQAIKVNRILILF